MVSGNQERVDQALTLLPAGSKGFTANLRQEAAIAGLFKKIGPIDHLVFTAVESLRLGKLADTNVSDAREFFNLRYRGAFMAVKYATPHIRPGGSIVLTGGIVAQSRPASAKNRGSGRNCRNLSLPDDPAFQYRASPDGRRRRSIGII